MALDEAFGLQLCVGVGYRGSVHAEHGSQLAAGRDAIAGAQVTSMH
jgi:hypothetical protein